MLERLGTEMGFEIFSVYLSKFAVNQKVEPFPTSL
jgi:hypothetical protein